MKLNNYNKKRRNQFKYFLILLIIISLIGSLVYFFYYSESSRKLSQSNSEINVQNYITEKETKYEYKFTQYFVPVTNLKNYKNNINIDELKNIKELYALQKDKLALTQILEKLNITLNLKYLDNIEDFYNTIQRDKDAVGILSLDELDIRVKALSFENHFLFDREKKGNEYLLSYAEIKISPEKTDDQTNYSHSDLNILIHTGSMIPGRGVETFTRRIHNGDYTRLFEGTKSILFKPDILTGTFEAPVLGKGNGATCGSCVQFIGNEKFIDAVVSVGYDYFSLAANHIMDGGVDGLKRTQELLSQNNILYNGASLIGRDDAAKPVLIEKNGLKLVFIAFNDTPGRNQWADENTPGAANISDWIIDSQGRTIKYEPNIERIKKYIDNAKALNPDFVIAVMHWGGREYVAEALPYQRTLAKLLIENGVDIILGDHVHWVQQIEFIDDKPVFYGVGNYIFDQMWSIETRQGIFIELIFYKNKLINFRLHPHQLYLYDKGYPELLDENSKEYRQTLERIFSVSENI
ncbi:MAG: CapA family protein [Candidatus Dojkabacteria bacterium]|nr:CapA family protein [Candidatus Dojkabacteria bacterium]